MNDSEAEVLGGLNANDIVIVHPSSNGRYKGEGE